VRGEWYYGPPGSGKSMTARQENPHAYLKSQNKWWDNFDDEETVLIEEWTPESSMLYDHLLQWSDRYPVSVEYKGGAMMVRPKRIVITSNFTIEQCFNGSQFNLNALNRRFKVIMM